jgi:ankyrin repeat protein
MKDRMRMRVFTSLLLSILLTAASPAEAPVADAAQRGDADAVRLLLRQGADVNAAQGDGMTALHWVAEAGEVELAATLLYAGASVEARTRNGNYSPLHLASRAAKGEMVAALLEAGANAGAVTSWGSRSLHFAAGAASPGAVMALLNHEAEVDARESSYAQTPLMWAAAYGHTEIVELLLSHGADLTLFSRVEDISALSLRNRDELRRRNARVDAMIEFETAEKEGRDAELAGTGVARTIEEFQDEEQDEEEGEEEEAKPLSYDDLVGSKGGLTPLHFAAREGHGATVRTLVAAGADIDRVTEGDHSSPMLLAAIGGHFDLAVELLGLGADPDVSSDAGATPLYAALNLQWHPKSIYPQPQAFKQQQKNYRDLMRAMLEAGADPDIRLEKRLWYMEYNFSRLSTEFAGSTPFWRAAYAQDVAALKLLVEFGADPTIPTKLMPSLQSFRGYELDDDEDQSGLEPVPLYGPASYAIHAATGIGFGAGYAGGFHRGSPNGWLPTVQYLVEELGADVNARDEKGFTPLHHAASRGDVPVIEFLLAHGADAHLLSRAGQTTADMANSPVQRVPVYGDALRLLEELGVTNNHKCQVC